MNCQPIENIRRKFPNEWLLIKIKKMDNANNPLTGRLLTHDPNRDIVYKKSLRHKGLIFIDHSGDKLPKGYAAAF